MYLARIDSIPYEPVKIGRSLLPADVALTMASRPPIAHEADISEIVFNFDSLFYLYVLLILSFLGAFIGVIPTKVRKRVKLSCKRIIRRIVKPLWAIFEAVVDQENYNPPSWPKRIAWLFACLAIFVTVFGYFLNLMSVEKVALKKMPEINKLADLLISPDFQDFMPFMSKSVPISSYAKASGPNTLVGQLYQRVLRKNILNTTGVLDLTIEDQASLVSSISLLKKGVKMKKLVMVMERDIWNKLLKAGNCIFMSDLVESSYMSKESFAPGIMANFYNKRIDSELEKVMNYVVSNAVELGLIDPILERFGKGFIQNQGQEMDFKAMKCYKGLKDAELTNFESFGLLGLRNTFIMLIAGCLIAFFGCCFECFIRKVVEHFFLWLVN